MFSPKHIVFSPKLVELHPICLPVGLSVSVRRQGVNGALFALIFRGRPLKTFALQVLQNADSTNIQELCDFESESLRAAGSIAARLGRLPAVTPSISLLHGG